MVGGSPVGCHQFIYLPGGLYCIKPVWMVAFTRQPFQPEAVGKQQVVQCAVQAAEEDADVKPPIFILTLWSSGTCETEASALISGKLP
jgi:hypothetical protein